MTGFGDDINHSTAARGVGASEGLKGVGEAWDIVTERKEERESGRR